ncbi:iron ABC transporter permease [Gracilinema caldarium]|uniref:FecCD family ABC transporter permease n=1 Tax=Gracilinema caldarium TaxID=215591 RepID=UPI0026EC37CB|nr:iron ABC transporter permease [Gracilinema caldarium]
MSISRRASNRLIVILAGLFVLVIVISAGLGRFFIAPQAVVRLFWLRLTGGIVPDELAQASLVLFRIRLPRLAGAALAGSALAASGAAYQGLFRNPLVSPDVLGVTAGAAFGAVLSLFWGLSPLMLILISFSFGLGTAMLVGFLAQKAGANTDSNLALVLAGIMVGSLVSSATSLIKLLADPNNVLPALTYWLMGGFSAVKEVSLFITGPIILAALLLLFALRWRINILTMGEEEARTLGGRVALSRTLVIIGATLATAATVALCGPVGWLGLVIPHFARMTAGSDYRLLLPVSILMGAAFLVVVDDFSRLLAASEIPIGILTSFVGVPVFLALIRRGGTK